MTRLVLSPGDRAVVATVGVLFAAGLVVSAAVPGAERVLNTVAVVAVVLVVGGWVVFHAVGEARLWLEVHRPVREPRAGQRTVLEQQTEVDALPRPARSTGAFPQSTAPPRAAEAPAGDAR